jgi:hypothetical protein
MLYHAIEEVYLAVTQHESMRVNELLIDDEQWMPRCLPGSYWPKLDKMARLSNRMFPDRGGMARLIFSYSSLFQ